MHTDIHTLLGGLALACIAIGLFIILHVIADKLEAKAERKRRMFDLDD